MAQFLDTNGLKTLINEIKTFVNNKFSNCLKNFSTTLGVEAGAFPELTHNNYVPRDVNITNAIDELDIALKKVENKINNSGGSVDLTDVNDKISKLEGGVESLNTKSDVNDNAHELYNELMIFNNLLETQDFSNNWVCYDEGYNEIENGIESKLLNESAVTYNGLPVYRFSDAAINRGIIKYIKSSQTLNITKPGKYILSFYTQYTSTNTSESELGVRVYMVGAGIGEEYITILQNNANEFGLIKIQFEIKQEDLDNLVGFDDYIEIQFNRCISEDYLNFTPFMLHCVNQDQDLNEVLEPITSNIDTLTYKVNTNTTDITTLKNNVSTNSVAINEHTSIIETLGNEENLENWKMYDYNGESYDFIDAGNEYKGLKIYKENITNENYITHIESSQVFNVYKPGKYILYFYSQFNPQSDNVELKAKACIYSEGSVYDEGSVCCEGKSVIIPINRNGYDLIKLQFEITQNDLDNIVDYINHIRIIIDNGSDENNTGIPLGAHNLMITPFVLYGKNQNQDLNEVLEPITSSIDTLTANVSTNSLAINEQKGMIDNVKGSCCELIHLNMDFSARGENFDQNAYVLPDDDLKNITESEYPNIIAHISGSYDPAKAQGVNLTGGDEVLYKFETVTYINKLDDSAVAHVQGCLTDMAGGFPGIYSYYININLKEIGETPAGYWNVTNGGVKMF